MGAKHIQTSADSRCTLARRRLCCLLILAIRGTAKPRFGDDDWMRAFRTFIKACNAFVIALDDGKLDLAKWEEMRSAWRKLDAPS